MKECRVQGIMGSFCRKNENSCMWDVHVQLESERTNLPNLLKDSYFFDGCHYFSDVIKTIKKRIKKAN